MLSNIQNYLRKEFDFKYCNQSTKLNQVNIHIRLNR